MMKDLRHLSWPVSRLGEAIQLIAEKKGFGTGNVEPGSLATPAELTDPSQLGLWIEGVAAWLGLEAEPVRTSYAEVSDLVRRATPALLQYGLWIGSWWVLGRMALSGRLDFGWLVAWQLVLLTIIPFQLLSTHAGGVFAIRVGAILKRRLFFGALKVEPDEIRRLGIGQLLGQVIESELLESMALQGAFLCVTALIELTMAGAVFAFGAQSLLHVMLLIFWGVLSLFLFLRYVRARQLWTAERLDRETLGAETWRRRIVIAHP